VPGAVKAVGFGEKRPGCAGGQPRGGCPYIYLSY